ncbi:hypothetical protein [Chitinasiproducens palmae]|uniref:Uncharacterized protein n=1 Tax=Chitinasiproducens palmae TaxID=1770053 RepID=A0A1H2PQI6_9BURK|nr:hypothetical protein [Chitinasiproducens palmae]SDV49060.1 hypothetical protein SAMN05216551_10730 [Chitinasiproducens palmae]
MNSESPLSEVAYSGDGHTQTFPIPFYFANDADLLIATVNAGTINNLVLDADYTVSGAGTPLGGSLTTAAVYDSSHQIVVKLAALSIEPPHPSGSQRSAGAQRALLARLITMVQQHQVVPEEVIGSLDANGDAVANRLDDRRATASGAPITPERMVDSLSRSLSDSAGLNTPEPSPAPDVGTATASRSFDMQADQQRSDALSATDTFAAAATIEGVELDSIAALRAYDGSAMSAHVADKAAGSPPGGKSGNFIRDDTDTGTTTDDGAEFVRDSLNRLWHRRYSGPRLARWWGVTGDGVDCGTAVAAALAAGHARGGCMSFPIGEVNWGNYRHNFVTDANTRALDIDSEGITRFTFDNIDPPARPDGVN